MPRSTVSKSKKFREFSQLQERYVGQNYCKNIRYAFYVISEKHGISRPMMEFMLYVYDLEFWTIYYVCDQLGLSVKKMPARIIYPLLKEEYIYKHFDKLTPSSTSVVDQMFREETKYNYRVRYALSQKGRLMVQRFYRELE